MKQVAPLWNRNAALVFSMFASATAAIPLPAQTFTTLHDFRGTDGLHPNASLIQGTDGNLYGATQGDGTGGASNHGTVFKITPSGTLTTLYSFPCSGFTCPNGEVPNAIIQAANGNFYGTTYQGGATGGGTVFVITPDGTLTTIHNFGIGVGTANGAGPKGPLIQAADRNLYGTTSGGGTSSDGTVFRITPSGAYTTLYSFCSVNGCADGRTPYAGLTQGADGGIYGTTSRGGTNDLGTVFKITTSGALTTLYNFCALTACADGAEPYGGLVQGVDGDLYGTTFGNINSWGTVFRITPGGALTTLYTFCSQSLCTDGTNSQAGLIQATDGNFYGTTGGGGDDPKQSGGTVFQITPAGVLTTLHSFCTPTGCPAAAGSESYTPLLQATNGMFYGTTYRNYGTIFSVSNGLGPFVETQTRASVVGSVIGILGTNLAGATKVSFEGTKAVFTVVSDSLITATVPTGAHNGNIWVVTPSGTLLSNAPFQVLP